MIAKTNTISLNPSKLEARLSGILHKSSCLARNCHHPSHKRWLSRTLVFPSQTSRFTVSSQGSISSQALSSRLQLGDSANIDKLATCDEILLVQKELKLEESENNTRREYKYEIRDKYGEKLFNAVQIYETYPPKFDFKLYGPCGSLLITHKLLQNLSSHLLSMQIIRPGGMYIGSIEEKLDLLEAEKRPPIFELKDSRDEVQAIVLTDFTSTKFGLRRTIEIFTPDQSKTIGTISKRWSGFSDKLVMCIHLPTPTYMNTQFRASLIGLCILLSQRYTR